MQEEQPKRKPRIPLSKEELFYVKEIKKLKELKRIADFKATKFYKVLNRVNIVLAGFLSYCVLSVLICCLLYFQLHCILVYFQCLLIYFHYILMISH